MLVRSTLAVAMFANLGRQHWSLTWRAGRGYGGVSKKRGLGTKVNDCENPDIRGLREANYRERVLNI
jgi:hypothetical protein